MLVSLAAAWIACTTCVSAQPAAPAADVARLVAMLGADDWSERQTADAALRAVDGPGLAPLLPFLVRADLSPEQSVRLRDIALERFKQEPHAGMGVQWDPAFRFGVPRQTPVVIGQLVEGFDAASKLRPGDAIAAMDGVPLPSQEEMRAAILSHSPGDTVSLSVFRGPLRLEVQITLGDFAALRTPERPSDATLTRALEFRLRRIAPEGVARSARAIGGGSVARWNMPVDRVVRYAAISLPGEDDELGGLLVGGEAHGASPAADLTASTRPTIRLAPTTGRPPIQPPAVDQRGRPALAPPTTTRPPAPQPAPRP